MYFANYETIDGIDIIQGVDKKAIDRIETQKRIENKIQQTKEFKAVKARIEKAASFQDLINEAVKSQKRIISTVAIFKQIPLQNVQDSDFTLQQREKMSQLTERINHCKNQIAEVRKDLPELNKKLDEKKVQLIKENAVYFGMPKNCIDISEAQYNEFLKKLQENKIVEKETKIKQLLKVTGESIIDNRNKTVWLKASDKWESRQITSLTDTVDKLEITENDLSEEQRQEIAKQAEIERLSLLTEEEKLAEFEIMKQSILAQSINMKNQLEIQGDASALQISKDWYNEELSKLKIKYEQ